MRWPRIPALGAIGAAFVGVGVVWLNTMNGNLPRAARAVARSFAGSPTVVPTKNVGVHRIFAAPTLDIPGAQPVKLAPVVELDLYTARLEALRKRCKREARSHDGIPGQMHTVALGPTPGYREGIFAECWSGKVGADGFVGEDKIVWSKWVCTDNPDARCDIIPEGDD